MTSRIFIARRTLTVRFPPVTPSPTQLAWRGRIEAVLRVAAPALDLLLAVGDRVSRVVDRDDDDLDRLPPGSPVLVPSRRRVGPGAAGADGG